MDQNLNPYDPAPGTPAPAEARTRRLPRAAAAGGLVAVVALAGAGLAFAASGGSRSTATPAASGTSSTTQPATPDRPAGPFGKGRFGIGGRMFGRGLGGVVHGSVTLHSPSGYRTVEVQIGQVTQVSSSSITVKSSDGYSHTYAVQSSTVVDSLAGGIASVAKGDQIQLLATPAKGTDTAFNIVDQTKVGGSRMGFGFGPPSKSTNRNGASPSSDPSSSDLGGWPSGPGPQPSGFYQ